MPKQLRIASSVQNIPPKDVVSLHRGELDVVIVKNAVDPASLSMLADAFWNFPPDYRHPPAPGYELGVHHFRRSLSRYLELSEKYKSTLETLGGENNPMRQLSRQIGKGLRDMGLEWRLSQHDGRLASPYILRSWNDDGEYSLLPHDDVAQLRQQNQKGFEIQGISSQQLVATNLCIQKESGGELVLWDYEASDHQRAQLGLEDSGYPYPTSFLSKFDKLEIELCTGDLAMFRGQRVHAVKSSPRRLVGSFFSGMLHDNQIIYWT